MHIIFWLFDVVIHVIYVIFKAKVEPLDPTEINHYPWIKYLSKNGGRYKFQIVTGLALIEHGLSLDWPELSQPRPNYMKQIG